MDDAEDFHGQFCHMKMSFDEEDEEFLRNILQQQPAAGGNSISSNNKNNNHLSSSSSSQSRDKSSFPTVDFSIDTSGGDRHGGGGSNEDDKSHVLSANKAYILAFDHSNVLAAEEEGIPKREESSTSEPCSLKRNRGQTCNNVVEPRKKTRSRAETANHIMAERRRRQQLTERFIALSATIPGLKKMDKATILQEATKYVKQLQERVTELEKQNSIIINTSSSSSSSDQKSSMRSIKKYCELHRVNIDDDDDDKCCEAKKEVLPQIDAKVLENQLLFGIYCEKQKGIEFKILNLLESFHLYVTSSSVLPFGNSTLGITIIAQKGVAYGMTVNEVMKSLRQMLSKSQGAVDPY